MPTTRRSRMIDAPAERVWELVSDAHHMPRWWPGVSRVEGVDRDRFTQVHMTKKGRGIRLDFDVLESRAPGNGAAGVRRFEQEVIGTPFERVLTAAVTSIVVTPAEPDGSLVELALEQRLRGSSKLGGFMLRRAARARLDEALENLERIC
jgi:ribosome-associated toxin RatA of RatAB toxin-antitoxin module